MAPLGRIVWQPKLNLLKQRRVDSTKNAKEKISLGNTARLVNSIFQKLNVPAPTGWNISGELCTGSAVDSTTDIQSLDVGIKCDCSHNNGTLCHITGLRLFKLDRNGSLPVELWNLTSLQTLNLEKNYFRGPLPAAISQLTRLQHLNLSFNSLSGQLPKELGLLTDLRVLSIGINNFTGSFPSELGNLIRLTEINFDSAGIRGVIPPSFARLRNLSTIRGSDNQLTGQIPDFIGKWSLLRVLRLQGNSFQGTIPSSFSNLTSLTDLRISDLTQENGSYSLEFIRNMKSLNTLVLRNNNASGSIPSYIGELQNLQHLDLSFNSFSGHIPESLFNVANLTHISLGNNNLTGSLPQQKSSHLQNIDLSYNELSGSFPSWTNDQNLKLNLVANNFTLSDLGSSSLPPGLYCLQRNFPCYRGSPIYSNFSIKCGGPALVSSDGIQYEADNQTNGPATYYVTKSKRWAVSNAGFPVDDFNPTVANASPGPEKKNQHGLIVGIVVPIVTVSFLLAFAVFFLIWRRKRVERWQMVEEEEILGMDARPYAFSYAELRAATNGFNPSNKLGEGGFGTVFKCLLLVVALASSFSRLAVGQNQTDPFEARLVNSMFQRLGVPAPTKWNFSGELCSGLAIVGSTNLQTLNPGIKCYCDYGNTCHITALRLYEMDLVGLLPHELWNLTYLEDLDLRRNYFTGSIPSSISRLTRMQYLAFGHNALSGEIPKELGMLTDLRSLAFDTNNFTGYLPAEIGHLTRLTQFYFSSSGISGVLPPSFAGLQSLDRFDGSNTQLTGPIPDFIGNWSSLSVLNLRDNNISGSIPSNIGDLRDLQQLDLSSNSLSGRIPDSLFKIPALTHIKLPPSLFCLQRNFPRYRGSPRYYNFSIKCGGPALRTADGILYEADNQASGPATYYVAKSRRWAMSSAVLPADDFVPTVSNIPPSSKNNRASLIARIVVPVGTAIFLFLCYVYFFIWRKRRQPMSEEEELVEMDARPYTFSYAELMSATDGFNPANKLGEGGFGAVFKGEETGRLTATSGRNSGALF
ncbi:OLC1v1007547C1 [Oldenlandia corymbosa var. corymbosa]|uniref:OLC1v1007547C1 n=1 Tax=Oldenlandia corymbosa var. corymbosa TaxID=529605 RepID=A0AAV1DJF2_OLDCO|nr:OLC1v1007547C1 [Oldenlandia corymbosa var. corymbosa]